MALGPRARFHFRQTEAWLRDRYPVDFRVSVQLIPKIAAAPEESALAKRYGHFGDSYNRGRGMVVRVSLTKNRTLHAAIDTLLHEWAHVRARKERLTRPHGPRWRKEWGKIYEHFVDRGGIDEARRYRIRR